MVHELKIREPFADAVVEGSKRFEIRENDRGFNAGDLVRFQAVDDHGMKVAHAINGKLYEITYVLSGWGLENGYVAFGIARVVPLDPKIGGVVFR